MQEENSNLNEFLSEVRRLTKDGPIKQDDLAEKLGLSQPTISRMLKGETEPGFSVIPKLANIFNLNLREWFPEFAGGDGDCILREEPPKSLKEWGGPYYGTTHWAPVISWARAGKGGHYEDQGLDVPHVPVSCKDGNCYVLSVEGDSMMPVFLPGDLLVVSPMLKAQVGDLVICVTKEEEVLFKKVQRLVERKSVRLVSFNPNHEPLDFHMSEIDKLQPLHSFIRPLKEKIFLSRPVHA